MTTSWLQWAPQVALRRDTMTIKAKIKTTTEPQPAGKKVTTLRELTTAAKSAKAVADREKAEKQAQAVLAFCKTYAEQGLSDVVYRGPVSPEARKILQGEPELLRLVDLGQGYSDCWQVYWSDPAE